jgi:hypothetical protein
VAVKFVAARRWKASLLGQKIVRSEAASRGATREAWVAAPARAVKLPVMRVSETERGMRRSLSMMWITPLSKARSWGDWVSLAGIACGRRGQTHGFNHLARGFDAAGYDRVAFFVQVHGNDLSACDIAAADFAIQHKARVVEITRDKLRNLLDVRCLDNSPEQVVSQDLLDESGIDSSLLNAEDATFRNDGCKCIVAWCEERDVLLRREEFGGVLNLTEQSDESGERFLAGEDCCEVLCRGKGGSECCQEKIVGTHFSGRSKVGFCGRVCCSIA